MKVFLGSKFFDRRKSAPLALALGNFDGVHCGHQAILNTVKRRALDSNLKSAVFTFQNHPQHVLLGGNEPRLLTQFDHKLALLDSAGIDICVAENFSTDFSKMSAIDFVKQVLVERLGVHSVCMGTRAQFGHRREGNAQFLKQCAEQFGFEFLDMQPVSVLGQNLSSSLVRAAVSRGNFDLVQNYLNRPYAVYGTVISGTGRGRQIGFPTANLEIAELMPPQGVYAVMVKSVKHLSIEEHAPQFEVCAERERTEFCAVLNYGTRPTFGLGSVTCEVHLLDFSADLRGNLLEVVFVERLRDEKKFRNESELKQQISKDIVNTKKIFSKRAVH